MTKRSHCPVFAQAACPRLTLVSVILCLVIVVGSSSTVLAESSGQAREHGIHQEHLSLGDTRLEWPTWEQFFRVLLLRDYNTRVVMLGTLILGTCAGAVGTFLLLKKRSLVGDVVSHASLPGIAIAFMSMEMVRPGSGKSLPGLLAGAFLAGLFSVLCIVVIRKLTRIKEDAALAIVLSIFFGLGIGLFTVIQNIPSRNQAGLHHFIFGKAASMIHDDVTFIAAAAIVVLLICGGLFKEFSLLCFDEDFAAAQGWPVIKLDLTLMGLVVVVTVIGLQSVGLLLVVAMLIIPASSARFWTDRMGTMTLVSAALGGIGAFLGILVSALFPRLSAGAVIVLVGSTIFLISLCFGSRRGVIGRMLAHIRLKRKVGRLDLLRAFYECLESQMSDQDLADLDLMANQTVSFESLLAMRSWTAGRLEHLLSHAKRHHLLQSGSLQGYQLTSSGVQEARRVVRNHRLWETYLINYADIAPSHVDRDADLIEHVLEPEVIEELDALLAKHELMMGVPASPHPIERPVAATR